MKNVELPLPACELLPHRETMLLVDELHSYDRAQGLGMILAEAKSDTVFSDSTAQQAGGCLEEVVVLEMMAQAYACLRGYEDRLSESDPSLGFLVGVRHFNSWRRVGTGEILTIEVATKIQIGEFYIADAVVKVASEPVAEAELKLWVPSAAGGSN
ncbi:hypothetical protein KAI46_07230 [bacterium]|nr:hypothetical protein [bacterium]